MVGSKVVPDEIMDRRVVSRKILEGAMAAEDLEKYLNELPDLSENVEEIIIGQED